MKKSYYIKTFRINGSLIIISILSIMVRTILEIMNTFLLPETNSSFIQYTQFIKKYEILIGHGLDKFILIVIFLLLLLVLPEFIFRVTKDSLLNYIKSYWITYRLRKFLIKHIDYDSENEVKIQKHNLAIKKAIIDVRDENVVFVIKLPNDYEIQKSITQKIDGLREEISSLFPYYVFSNFERKKHLLILEGTNFR